MDSELCINTENFEFEVKFYLSKMLVLLFCSHIFHNYLIITGMSASFRDRSQIMSAAK